MQHLCTHVSKWQNLNQNVHKQVFPKKQTLQS